MEKKRPICAPCHKYILQNLKTHTDAAEFEKSFLQESVKDGFSKEESYAFLLTALMYLPQDSPVTKSDFALSDYPDYDALLTHLKNDPYLKEYNSCRSFYRRFDSMTSMCVLCNKYDRCLNVYRDKEASLLRYAMEDITNYDAIKEQVDSSVFLSVFDIAEGMRLPKPVVVSAYRFLYEAFCQNIYEYFNYSFGGHPSSVLMKHFIECISSAKRLPPAITSRKNWSSVIFKIIMDTVTDAAPITGEEAGLIVSDLRQRVSLVKKKGKRISAPKEKRTRKEIPAPDPDDIIMLSAQQTGLIPSAECMANQDPDDKVKTEGTGTSTEHDLLLPAAINTKKYLPVFLPGDPYSRFHADDHADCEEITEQNELNHGKGSIDTEKPVYRVIEDKKLKKPAPEALPDDLIPIVSVNISMLSSCIHLTADTLARFENTICPNKKLYVEAVLYDPSDEPTETSTQDHEESEYLLLFYGRKERQIFYMDFHDHEIVKKCMPFLEHNSIVKICFAPYLLYSVGMLYGIAVKNVHSLMTTHYLLERSSKNYLYGTVLQLYEPNITLTDAEKSEDNCPYIVGMKMYAGAYHNQLRIIRNRDIQTEYEEQKIFDEMLGRSYLRERFFDTDLPLFALKKPGGYQFHDYNNMKPHESGVLATYTIEHAEGTGLIKNILVSLAEKGRFRTLPVMLLGMTATSFSVYMKADVSDYLQMQISLVSFEQMKQYQSSKKKKVDLVICHTEKHFTV